MRGFQDGIQRFAGTGFQVGTNFFQGKIGNGAHHADNGDNVCCDQVTTALRGQLGFPRMTVTLANQKPQAERKRCAADKKHANNE